MWAVAGVLLILLIWPAFQPGSSPEHRLHIGTLSNFKQVATSVRLYMIDNDERFPPQFSTQEDLRDALASYELPELVYKTTNPNGGKMMPNSELAGIKLSAVLDPAETAMIYETKDWPDGKVVIAAVDTSTRFVDSRDLINLDPGTIEFATID